MEEKRLVDANHFMQVLKNIEYALKGELTHGKIKTSVVQMIEGSLNAEPTIAPESLQPLTYNENRDYVDCDEFICHKCGIHVTYIQPELIELVRRSITGRRGERTLRVHV